MKNRVINKSLALLMIFCTLGILASCGQKSRYEYKTVANDPMNVKEYTMANGLKVFMTVNKEQPRIQTYIAVHTGSKNDPAETTGLAHYLEHLMFKGTSSFGTQDFEKEKPLLDTITTLFEQYRQLTDPAERKAAYHVIDSISGVASQYAIPNEYDKMMAMIGANGSNAFTSNEVTCYQEDIPSNQIENWARIESDRFKDPVFRLFHTELEAVYEEKNISMASDMEKEYEALLSMLYPTHPYGTQTTIGTQEHLKNPSLVNIQNYFNKWYVPGNVAICLSGDFDPDQMIDILEKYFGDWKARDGYSDHPEQLTFEPQPIITEPQKKEVIGQEAENVMLGWRFEGVASAQMDTLNMLTSILSNGTAGLMDLDLTQKQKVLQAGLMVDGMTDYTTVVAYGMPQQGQSLDSVRALILEEVEKVANGEFDETLVNSVLTEQKLNEQHALESNEQRAMQLVDAFINGEDWSHCVGQLDRQSKLTKQNIVDFARRHLTSSNYVYVNKLQGVDPNIQHIDKPEITPVQSNRDVKSKFLTSIEQNKPADIEPAFIDYDKAIAKSQTANGLELLCEKNVTNQLFELDYIYDMGQYADKVLPFVADYSNYVGTSDMTPDKVQSAFYALGCNFRFQCEEKKFKVVLSGLDENLSEAVALLDKVMGDAQSDDATYAGYLPRLQQARADAKLQQASNFSSLVTYSLCGADYVKANTVTNEELQALSQKDLTDRIHSLLSLKHRVAYYGPSEPSDLAKVIEENHHIAASLKDCAVNHEFPMLPTTENIVYEAPYIANNTYLRQVCNIDSAYNTGIEPVRAIYNEYFGGSMNAIVFQEMRETRGLAYSAWANFNRPYYKSNKYNMQAEIITQNDKLPEAIGHFNEIIEEMPQSEAAFNNAKTALISRLRTERTVRMEVINTYLDRIEEFGLKEDPRKTLFEGVQSLTLQDVLKFQQEWVKGRKYAICVLGDPKQLNQDCLKQKGTVKNLTTEEIFGY